jgi:hypothetical protein
MEIKACLLLYWKELQELPALALCINIKRPGKGVDLTDTYITIASRHKKYIKGRPPWKVTY